MAEYLAQYQLKRMLYDYGDFHLSHEKEVKVFLFEAKNNDQSKQKAEDYRLKQLREIYLPGSLMTLNKIFEVKEIKL